MDSTVIADFEDAQRRAIALLSAVHGRVEAGQSERDIAELATSLLSIHGFEGWFHPPEVQIGVHTTQAPIWRIPSPSIRLKPNDALLISLGPWGGRAFGDIGSTFVFEGDEPPILEIARACTRATCGYASRYKCIGELFIYAQTWALNNRLSLANRRSIGHALLPPEGPLAWNFPRSAHAATWLRRHQIHFLNPRRMTGIFAIRPQITDGRLGASFQEVVIVDGDVHRVLGRDHDADVGKF